MKKRFTDCDRFDDPWFRKLPLEYKLLWDFITSKCDNSGVWKVDFELAGFMIGHDSFDCQEALNLFNNGKKRINAFKDGYWHIVGFVDFQFGGYGGNNNFHKQIRSLIESHGLNEFQGQTSPSSGALEKEKEEEKEKDREKEEGGSGEEGKMFHVEQNGEGEKPVGHNAGDSRLKPFDAITAFAAVWEMYPQKVGRSKAWREFFNQFRCQETVNRLQEAIRRYAQYLGENTWQHPMNLVNFLDPEVWLDWETYDVKQNIKPESKDDALLRRLGGKK